MKQTIIEVIKENKKTIITKALIVGGTIVGLALAFTLVKPDVIEGNGAWVDSEEPDETVETEESSEEI